jgi:hypothetical protein
VCADTVAGHEQCSSWAGTAANKFRQAAKASDDPATTLIAEGLTALAEAVRDLGQEQENLKQQVRAIPR